MPSIKRAVPLPTAAASGGGPTVAIDTHGCKLNQADSMRLFRQFQAAGYRPASDGEPIDVYVLNSCTVTHVADSKARQAIRSLRRRHPDATVVATGCYAERSPGELRRMAEVDLVIGNSEKEAIVARVMAYRDEVPAVCAVGDDPATQLPRIGRTRAMVRIQRGCDQVCAYCIVPKVRGRERSVPPDEIVAEIDGYATLGYREAVLTGTQLGSYGFDIPGMSLTRLLERVLSETQIARIRVSSLQPQDIDAELLSLWVDARMCPHLHMPLQSGSDRILQRMRRRYDSELYAATVGRIREAVADVSITADVLVGFPGESPSDFGDTYALCERMEFAGIHVFPYSSRPGTSAAHFSEQVAPEAKAERVRALIELAKAHEERFRERFLGQTRPVLWEEARGTGASSTWTGLTDNYIRVQAQSSEPLANSIRPARLLSSDGGAVLAEVMPT